MICHALTGNSDVATWWSDLVGAGKVVDTRRFFVVCMNVLGSCYGTCGPRTVNPRTGHPYLGSFPDVTVRDCVALHHRVVRDVLGITQLMCVIGGSLGGMQALEWLLLPDLAVRSGAVFACNAQHAAWQIAIGESQRQAIYAVWFIVILDLMMLIQSTVAQVGSALEQRAVLGQ